MADNYFDKFDKTATNSNYFDKFDKPVQPYSKFQFDPTKTAQGGKDISGGVLEGAGSVGATIAQPFQYVYDKATGKTDIGLANLITGVKPLSTNAEMRKNMHENIGQYSNQDSSAYKLSKLGTEIGLTYPLGTFLGKGSQALSELKALQATPNVVSALSKLSNAIPSNGFNLGRTSATTLMEKAGDLGLRGLGGAINGGATAGLIDPSNAGTGAMIGGLIPLGVKGAAVVGNALNDGAGSIAHSLMQSALKPSAAMREMGFNGLSDSDTAIKTMLDNGINVSQHGVNKLHGIITNLGDHIDQSVANASGVINKADVAKALNDVRIRFANQATSTADLNAIEHVANDFNLSHPSTFSVQKAQDLKRGTYQILNGKYGEQGSAAVEAQKGLARGLKEGVESIIPSIKGQNAQMGDYMTAMDILGKATGRQANKDILGLAMMAHNPVSAIGMAADRSSIFKSMLARGFNSVHSTPSPAVAQGLLSSVPRGEIQQMLDQYGLLGIPSLMATSSP